MSEKDICPYCKNTGQIRVKSRKTQMCDRNGNPMEDFSYYTCFCVNNRIISKKYNRLLGIPDITPKEALNAGKFAGFHNFLIFGDEIKFLHLVKSTMILHANFHRTFEMLNGYDVIKKYYVEQQDTIQHSIDELENKDLLIFIFDVSMENKAQNKVVFEVIKRRVRMNDPRATRKDKIQRPTWIYSPTKEDFKESKEYSTEIERLIEDFYVLDLKKYNVSFKTKEKRQSQSRISLSQDLGNQ